MERNLINDPSKFEAKNIGGILTTRQLLTIVIASLAATPFVVLGLTTLFHLLLRHFLRLELLFLLDIEDLQKSMVFILRTLVYLTKLSVHVLMK